MRIPNHIALIPDGNRRWAQNSGMKKHEGYDHGLNPGVACLKAVQGYGVKELTYYGFTTDNCKRPSIEVEAFKNACIKAIELIQGEDAALLVVGNTDSAMFPKALLPFTEQRVIFGKGTTKVNFLVNYGWEWDLSCMHTISNNRNTIMQNLRSHEISRIDLVVRWGGRYRLSGLLPVQTVYADMYSINEMWPEYEDAHILQALKWYDSQDITLGG